MRQWFWLVLSALLGLTRGHVFYYPAIRIMGPIASEAGMLSTYIHDCHARHGAAIVGPR